MGLLPRALASSSSGGVTPPEPVKTTAKTLWDSHVVLTATDVANKYFDLPVGDPDIATDGAGKVIVALETTVQHVVLSYIATTNEAGKMRRISWNGLDLEDDPPMQVGYMVWVIYPTVVTLEGSAGTFKHDELQNRDNVDQHPIAAITGLQDALQRIVNDIQNIVIDNTHYKGWFADEAALVAAHPTGEAGDFATVGATNTVWLWNGTAWVDTGTTGEVSSITTPDGGKEAGDVNITINKLGLTGDPAGINDAVTKRHNHENKALLDTLKSDGAGDKFLNNKGQYVVTPGGGDMYKADYDSDGDGSVDSADTIMGYARSLIVNVINAASKLVINGDGTKFLNDKGQYVSQTAFMGRRLDNQEFQTNEIAANGKRYYGYYFKQIGVSNSHGTQYFGLPIARAAVDNQVTLIRDAFFRSSVAGGMTIYPSGSYQNPQMMDDPSYTSNFYIFFVNNASYPNTIGFQCKRGANSFSLSGTLEALIMYTKTSDSPIA